MADKFTKRNEQIKKWLQERIQRNEQMGLQSSPDDTSVVYRSGLSPKVGGYVRYDNPKKIVINPNLSDKGEDEKLKYVLAHELQHVNQNAARESGEKNIFPHESDDFATNRYDIHSFSFMPGGRGHYPSIRDEQTRVQRSLMSPSTEKPELYGSFSSDANKYDFNRLNEPDKTYKDPEDRPIEFSLDNVIKYAKEQGIPMDEIIDAMTMNYAIGNDKEVKRAHNETEQNQKQGRGILGKLGLEKPMSTEDVYKPWKELRKKRFRGG